ncbi:MAG: hypothetical protein ACFFFB_00030 [Candidatus Heimdallarchaeota archaeon]
MESKGLGLFLSVLGVIFLVIALATIWSMFLTWELWKGIYVILAVPLMVFGVSTMFFGIYLIFGVRLVSKVKGLILIITGIVPILGTLITSLDLRLLPFNLLQNLVFIPLILIGIFLIIYGIFLISSDWIIHSKKARKRANQGLGVISTSIGITNIVFFIMLVINFTDHPYIFSIAWLALGIVLIIFGIHLTIKKIEMN